MKKELDMKVVIAIIAGAIAALVGISYLASGKGAPPETEKINPNAYQQDMQRRADMGGEPNAAARAQQPDGSQGQVPGQ